MVNTSATRLSNSTAPHSAPDDCFRLGHSDLEPRTVWQFARVALQPTGLFRIAIDDAARQRIADASDFVRKLATQGHRVYGVNTGLGDFAEVVVAKDQLTKLQHNLIRSHCCGVGEELPRDIVMAMSLIRLNTICRGHSGTSPETVAMIVRMLEAGVLPCVPSRGSVGASGDLAPSAHAALVLLGEGYCSAPDGSTFVRMPAKEALAKLDLKPHTLGPKEGLSLINGTQLTTALAVKAWSEASNLLAHANLAAAMTFEGIHARYREVPLKALEQHGHPGTIACGREMMDWLHDPTILSPRVESQRIQDPYSIRCAPHVHGAVWDEVEHSEIVLRREINSSDDNPLLFPESGEVLCSGNFHAIQPARVSDKLASALTVLGTISERRINVPMSRSRTGLPDFLIDDGGLNSGFMMLQVTAAALASECKTLSVPASVDTIPTNCDREDHVSMGPLAGLKALQVAELLRTILAIELLVAAQAVDLRKISHLPRRLALAHKLIREKSAFLDEDRPLSEDIALVASLIEEGSLLRC